MILESVDVVQLHGGGKVIGELIEGGVHFVDRETRRDLVEYQIAIGADEFRVRVLEPSDRDQLPTPRGPLAGLAQDRPQNAIEPGADAGLVAELGEAKPGADARFLNRILGVGADAGAAHGEGQKAVEVREDKRVEERLAVSELLRLGHVL